MGVYIKGMKMPENCCDCLLKEESTFLQGMGNIVHCGWVCGVIHESISEQGFYSGILLKCPLVELPEPHGRLIDADALVPDICHDWEGGRIPPDYYSEKCIREAPTVIKAEGE